MAVETTSVVGKVLRADAQGAGGGSITLELTAPGTVLDGSTRHVVGGKMVVQISPVDGAVSFSLVPNDVITPAGTYWRATYRLPSGDGWEELWSVPSSPDPTSVGAIPRTGGPFAGSPRSIVAVSTLPTATELLVDYVFRLTVQDGSNPPGVYLCMKDPDSATHDWILIAAWPA